MKKSKMKVVALVGCAVMLASLINPSAYTSARENEKTSINTIQNGIVNNDENVYEKKDLAPTPPMGWNSWNAFMGNISEDLMKEVADAMVETGLVDAGYNYLVIDDGYIENKRDENGKLVPHKKRFPNGFNPVSDYVHAKGMKFGMYNSAGNVTCMGLPGSYGHEESDAKQFADWGVDFFKYDFCGNPNVNQNSWAPDLGLVTATKGEFKTSVESKNGELVGGARVNAQGLVGFVGNGEGEVIVTLNVPEDGTYSVGVKYIGADANRPLTIDVNGERINRFECPRTNSWNTSDAKTLTVDLNLKAGENKIRLYNPTNKEANMEEAYNSYKTMAKAFEDTGRDVLLSICEWGSNEPWLWADDLGHMWRTTYDITAEAGRGSWSKVMGIYDENVVLDEYAGPNGWNDPDMLVVGLEGISNEESKSHFSLWSIMAAPLIIGNDIRNMSDEVKAVLTNKDVIALNQDPLGVQGKRIKDNGDLEVIVKPLENGDVGIVLLNRGSNSANISVTMDEIMQGVELVNEDKFAAASSYDVKELWTKEEFNVESEIVGESIPAHGVKTYRVTPKASEETEASGKVSISAENEIVVGEKLDVTLGVSELKEGLEGYATDFTFTYDPDVFELDAVEGANESIFATASKVKEGEVRIVASSLGTPIASNSEVVKVKLTSKIISADEELAVTVAQIGNGEGEVSNLELASTKVTVKEVEDDKEIIVGKVNNLEIIEKTNNSAIIGWEAPESTVGLEEYVVYKDGKVVARVPVGTTEFEATGLRANSIYGFKVTAKFSNGKESKPQSINVRTNKN
ncbi:cohesin domain-containing protein [Clostridium sp.]|uniref:cohesin domain-containing protein n=1 Tax=Clostridium sp. TaxID=1506 RepID=UPI003F2D57D0